MQAITDELNILVIEDNPADLFLLKEMLSSHGLHIGQILTCDRSASALDIIRGSKINLVLLDLSLPDSFGIDTFLRIKPVAQKIPVIILTGLTDSDVALEALNQGAQDYLVKGEFNTDILVKSIRYSIERKNAEEKLLASEEKYKQMFYKNPFPAWIYDLDTLRILEINDAAVKLYGYERNEFLNLTINDIRPKEEIDGLMRSVTCDSIPEELKGKIWQHRIKNGEIIRVETAFYKIDYLGRMAMQVQVNDVTERFRLGKELAEQQKRKQRQITEAVLGAQEKERKLLGEELHDNINQILATSKLFLATSLRESNLEFVAKGEEYVSMAMEEIRMLSKTLVVPQFIKSGIKQPIEDLVEAMRIAKTLLIETNIEIPEESLLGDGLKLAIYRILQEQLNNIVKYADATAVTINVYEKESMIFLSILDNGKGFDINQQSKGIGFMNITNRAELYNGRVEIDSSPGHGCMLRAAFHIPEVATPQAA